MIRKQEVIRKKMKSLNVVVIFVVHIFVDFLILIRVWVDEIALYIFYKSIGHAIYLFHFANMFNIFVTSISVENINEFLCQCLDIW